MAVFLNFILLCTTIFLPSHFTACQENKELILPLDPLNEGNYLENLLQTNPPRLAIERSSFSYKRGLIGNFGVIIGNNPYFCNSFAFAEIDYLPPLPISCDSFSSLFSFRYLFADKKAQGFSIGGSTRFYNEPLCSVLGLNLFYDFKSIPCNHFYQMGVGFEYLRFLNCISLLEMRANIYFPLNKRFKVRAEYRYYPEEFIAIGTNTFYNSGGWEVELGKRFFYKSIFDLYFSLAPYHLYGQEYGMEYTGLFRWKSTFYTGIRLYQNITCSISDIIGFIGINIPLDREYIYDKNMPLRIPISRWYTIKLQSCINWKTNY